MTHKMTKAKFLLYFFNIITLNSNAYATSVRKSSLTPNRILVACCPDATYSVALLALYSSPVLLSSRKVLVLIKHPLELTYKSLSKSLCCDLKFSSLSSRNQSLTTTLGL